MEAAGELPPEYFERLKKEVERLINEVYAGKSSQGVFELTGKELADTVGKSYNNMVSDFDTPDAEMLARLTRDTWHFSAAKNWQQLRDLSLALKDENGKLLGFDSFKEQAEKICEKYNETWLRTEYNLAVASSQNAARWVGFEKEADAIPFLRYQTVGDDHVRDSHAQLDGIVKRLDDPFWNTHYPPNGYGCRCEAVQEVDGEKRAMPDKDTPSVGIPDMFKTNLAKTGLIYPKNHPYYNGVPKAELRKAIAYLPPKNVYMDMVVGDHEMFVHPLHGDKELRENINISKMLMDLDGKATIQLLPIIEEKDKGAKKMYLPEDYLKKFPLKNPDALYNGKVMEFETANGSTSSIQNAIKSGRKQSDFVVIRLSGNINFEAVNRVVKGQLKHYGNEEEFTVWVISDGKKQEYSIKQKQE